MPDNEKSQSAADNPGLATPPREERTRTIQASATQKDLAPSDALMLPSEHVDYIALMENELNNRVHGLQSGIATLEGVLAGEQQQHDAAVAEKTAVWEARKATLLRRIDNLKTALRMAKSGVSAKDMPQ